MLTEKDKLLVDALPLLVDIAELTHPRTVLREHPKKLKYFEVRADHHKYLFAAYSEKHVYEMMLEIPYFRNNFLTIPSFGTLLLLNAVAGMIFKIESPEVNDEMGYVGEI